MHTLAIAQTLKQLTALVTRIQALHPSATVRNSNFIIVVHCDDKKLLSAATAGGKWSVHVSANIAEEFKLPLWKDS